MVRQEPRTLLDLFDAFQDDARKPAMIFRTGVRRICFTYGELHDWSCKMAGWLDAQGIGPGDRVVLWAPNSPWWGIAFWGILARGAVVVPVDFMSGFDRAETIQRLTESRLVIQSRSKAERFQDGSVFVEDLGDILQKVVPLRERAVVGEEDMAELVYTSGTTGNPKGVILTHGNLVANLRQINEHIPTVTSSFAFLSLLPLSHMFEQTAGFLTPLYKGARIVYLKVLKPSAMMEAFAEEDIYAVIIVPRLLQLLKGSIERELSAKHLDRLFSRLMMFGRRLSLAGRRRLFFPIQKKFGKNFVMFVSGGAALDPVVGHFWEDLGFAVVEGYGLTECSPVVAANTDIRRKIGSVGRLLPEVEAKFANKELLIRGPNVFTGYYRNEEATAAAFTPDGWFRSGDLAELDPEGDLLIKGRRKELIVTGAGINVYPDELENVLSRISGLRESCVIGLDRGAGEEVHAVLILDGSGRSPQEIIDEANGQLDELHRITGFSLWADPEFPKTTTMKIQKFKVKQRLNERGVASETGVIDRLLMNLARVTGTPVQEISEQSLLVADLGLTSIARLELVNLLEVEFRLDLEDTAITPATRVADLRDMIAKRERHHQKSRLRQWVDCSFVRCLRTLADYLVHWPLIRLFVSLKVVGNEKLPKEGPVMFIANHISYLDQPVVMMALPPSWRYDIQTAAWEEFFFPKGKPWYVRLWKRLTYEYSSLFLGVFPLPQSSGFRPTLRHMGILADRGRSIFLFPEGERSRETSLLPFKLGLGVMVRELGLPIVPIRIEGIEGVLPRGARWPKRGNVTIIFGDVLTFGPQDSVGTIVEQARAAVEGLQR